jgi:hypothetical protein
VCKDDLPGGQWGLLAEVAAESQDRSVEIVDPAQSSRRFYQLVTPRIP